MLSIKQKIVSTNMLEDVLPPQRPLAVILTTIEKTLFRITAIFCPIRQ